MYKKHHSKETLEKKKNSMIGKNKGNIAWNRGLTKETDKRVYNNTLKLKEYINKNGSWWLNKKHTEETKNKMSVIKKELYKSGWECVAGRCKKYDYISPIAGKIKVDGTWDMGTYHVPVFRQKEIYIEKK